MDSIDFCHCCAHARRLMVDWEDRGWVHLLDMDHIICECRSEPEVVDIRNCCNCPNAAMETEEDFNGTDIEDWVKWSLLGGVQTDETSN